MRPPTARWWTTLAGLLLLALPTLAHAYIPSCVSNRQNCQYSTAVYVPLASNTYSSYVANSNNQTGADEIDWDISSFLFSVQCADGSFCPANWMCSSQTSQYSGTICVVQPTCTQYSATSYVGVQVPACTDKYGSAYCCPTSSSYGSQQYQCNPSLSGSYYSSSSSYYNDGNSACMIPATNATSCANGNVGKYDCTAGGEKYCCQYSSSDCNSTSRASYCSTAYTTASYSTVPTISGAVIQPSPVLGAFALSYQQPTNTQYPSHNNTINVIGIATMSVYWALLVIATCLYIRWTRRACTELRTGKNYPAGQSGVASDSLLTTFVHYSTVTSPAMYPTVMCLSLITAFIFALASSILAGQGGTWGFFSVMSVVVCLTFDIVTTLVSFAGLIVFFKAWRPRQPSATASSYLSSRQHHSVWSVRLLLLLPLTSLLSPLAFLLISYVADRSFIAYYPHPSVNISFVLMVIAAVISLLTALATRRQIQYHNDLQTQQAKAVAHAGASGSAATDYNGVVLQQPYQQMHTSAVTGLGAGSYIPYQPFPSPSPTSPYSPQLPGSAQSQTYVPPQLVQQHLYQTTEEPRATSLSSSAAWQSPTSVIPVNNWLPPSYESPANRTLLAASAPPPTAAAASLAYSSEIGALDRIVALRQQNMLTEAEFTTMKSAIISNMLAANSRGA